MDIAQWLYAQGPLGVFMVILYIAYSKKAIATGRELRQVEEACTKQLQVAEAALARERAERESERQELRKELSFWRENAWSMSKLADHVVGQLPVKKEAA